MRSVEKRGMLGKKDTKKKIRIGSLFVFIEFTVFVEVYKKKKKVKNDLVKNRLLFFLIVFIQNQSN